MPRIGLLALQGAFAAHGEILRSLGAETEEVRNVDDLDRLDGLVIPGGESTTLLLLMEEYGFEEPIRRFARSGRGLLATCMGVILLARQVVNPPQHSLGLLDISVARNAYGRQVESFEGEGLVQGEPFPMIFIRAPRILEATSDVDVLGTIDGEPVLVRQGAVFGATFHPELSGRPAVHQLFLDSIAGRAGRAGGEGGAES